MSLKLDRVKRDMTQLDISKLSEVGISTILKIEKYGIDNISVSTLNKLSNALDIPIIDLFFREIK